MFDKELTCWQPPTLTSTLLRQPRPRTGAMSTWSQFVRGPTCSGQPGPRYDQEPPGLPWPQPPTSRGQRSWTGRGTNGGEGLQKTSSL